MDLEKTCVTDVNFANKRVIIRSDLDVPVESGVVICNDRIGAAFFTVKYIIEHYCHSIMILSHLGKADGKRRKKYSLEPVAKELDALFQLHYGKNIVFIDDIYDNFNDTLAFNPPKGTVILCENIQFYLEEVRMSKSKRRRATREEIMIFHRHLEKYADIYVNDAFRFAHLCHASIAPYFYKTRVAGFSMDAELRHFQNIIQQSGRPIITIIGGNRIVDKLQVINYLLEKIDDLILGGAIAFTFLKVTEELELGDTLHIEGTDDIVNYLLSKADKYAVKVHLPEDYVVGQRGAPELARTIDVQDGIPDGRMALDIARTSTYIFADIIQRAKTILWMGPMGAIEEEVFSEGTRGIMYAVTYATSTNGATSIVVGEDTAAFIQENNLIDDITHVSMGRAAELLLMGRMPHGVKALQNKSDWQCM